MVLILPEHSQRPYRYGMTLLCVGAMFNWLGLADNNAEPVRYIGVTLIAAGAMLICLAMCFWMKATHDPQVAALQAEQDNIAHIVTVPPSDSVLEKPPDYDTVTGALPPSYEDAIKLSPAQLQLQLDSSETDGSGSKPVEADIDSSTDPATCSIPVEPTDTICQVHKPNNTGSTDDESATAVDNFGSRVLRISRKFLRRSRSATDVESDAADSGSTHATEVIVR